MMEESVNEEHADNNEKSTATILVHTEEENVRLPNSTPPVMMEKCEDIIHRDINKNETETNQDTLDKVI